jgi:hypothetical protein
LVKRKCLNFQRCGVPFGRVYVLLAIALRTFSKALHSLIATLLLLWIDFGRCKSVRISACSFGGEHIPLWQFLFDGHHSSMLTFCKSLAQALIDNEYYEEPESPCQCLRRRVETHELLKIPKNKLFQSDSTFEYCGTAHNCHQCSDCRRRMQTYCKCSPWIHLCSECYADHWTKVDSEA